MRKHIAQHYKSFDGREENSLDRLINTTFNEYGYNLESNSQRSNSLSEMASKSGPRCLEKRINPEKR